MASPIVVMGVSGSGKSTVGAALAQRLRRAVRRRRRLPPAGQHRQDDGRPRPRRRRPPPVAGERSGSGSPRSADGGVMSCSALKRSYRDQLRAHCPDVEFLHLAGHAGGHRPAAGQPARATSCRRRCWPRSSRRSSRSTPTSTASPSTSTRTSTPIVEHYVDTPDHHRTGELMSPSALTLLAADTELAEPVASGLAADPRRAGGHRGDRRADHRRQAAPVPRADLRRADRRHRRGREHRATVSRRRSPTASAPRPRASAS